MRFSVCIATFNRRETLAKTLPTVLDQDFPPDQFEVVVVDDGSTDGTAEYLSGLKPRGTLRVYRQQNRGQAVAQNVAFNAARGELVLLLDDDILCDTNLLREHDAAHPDGEPRFVFGPILIAGESRPSLATTLVSRDIAQSFERLQQRKPQWPNDAMADANTSTPAWALRRAGGMDESFVLASNSALTNRDLGLRLWKTGLGFHFQPSAAVRQIHLKTCHEIISRDARFSGRNEVLLARKNPEYRTHSPLASLGKGSIVRRVVRKAAATAPISPDYLLRLPFAAAEHFRSVRAVRWAGTRLLQARLAISTYRGAVEAFGPWDDLLAEFGRRLPVLIYHHVGPTRPGTYPELTVSPAVFERQMGWLARHDYTPILPSDWLAWCRRAKPLPPKPVMLTFDDAYADLVEHAFPVLQHHGFVGGVYVVTFEIGGTNTWDQVLG